MISLCGMVHSYQQNVRQFNFAYITLRLINTAGDMRAPRYQDPGVENKKDT
jgi:hypothetical protein